MGIRVEMKGLGIDDAPSTVQRRYAFQIVSSSRPDAADVAELEGLLGAWYGIGSHGGFGAFMHQAEGPVHEEGADGWHTTYAVVGTVTHQAVAILLRCFDVSDIDLTFERVEIDVTPYD